ncbi:hypothetical protein FCV25MIE_19855, partial [Fagus crenata]
MVRSQVLAQDPLPSVRNAFAFVRREELRQATMMAVKFHDGFAMVAGASSRPLPMVPDMSFGNSRPPSVSPRSKVSSNRKCTYRNGTNHIRETCFKLNGYPEWFVQKKGTQTKGNNSGPKAHHISIGSQASIPSQ